MKTPRRGLDASPHSCKVSPRLPSRSVIPAFATPLHSSQARRLRRPPQPPPDLTLFPGLSKSSANSRNQSPTPQKSVCISVRIPDARPSLKALRKAVIERGGRTPSVGKLAAGQVVVRFGSAVRERKAAAQSPEERERKEEEQKLAGRSMRRGISLGHDFHTSVSLQGCRQPASDESQARKILTWLQDHFSVLGKYPKTSSEYYKPVQVLSPLAVMPRLVLAVHRLTNLPVVVKSVAKASLKDLRMKRKTLREVANQSRADHPHIVKLLEVYESAQCMNLVFEYCKGGSLVSLLRREGKLRESEARRIFSQLVGAVHACHSQGIVHREIKLSTVLLTESLSEAKLSDFSASLLLAPGERLTDRPSNLAYAPPESLLDHGYDGYLADIWSLGVVLYAMLVGELPFRSTSATETIKAVLKGEVEMSEDLSLGAREVVMGLLRPAPQDRLSIDAVLAHHWLYTDTADFAFIRQHDAASETDPSLNASLYVDSRALVALEEAGVSKCHVLSCLQSREANNLTAAYELMRLHRVYSICGSA